MRYPPYNLKTTSLMRTLMVNRWVEAEAGQCSAVTSVCRALPDLGWLVRNGLVFGVGLGAGLLIQAL